MKSFEEQILELSKLVESGRLPQEEFDELKKGLEEKEALKIRYAPKVGKYSADSDIPLTRVPMEPAKVFGYSDYNTRSYSDSNTRKAECSVKEESSGTGFSVSGVIFGTTYYVCIAISLMLFFGVIAPSAFKLIGAVLG